VTDAWLNVILVVLAVVGVVGVPVLAVTEHRREAPLQPIATGVGYWQDHTVPVPGIHDTPNGFVGDTNPDWAWSNDAWPTPAAGPQALVAVDRYIADTAIRVDVAWERNARAALPAELTAATQPNPVYVAPTDDGFDTEYAVYTPSQGSVDAAIRKGLTIGRDDDFNIWVLRLTKDEGHKLVATLWMHEVVDDDPVVLARLAEKAGL